MHELSIAIGIVEIAEKTLQQNSLGKVVAVHIAIGELTCVDESALRFALEPASKGTAMEGAEIIIHRQTALATCVSCGEDFEPVGFVAQCPSCQGFETKIIKGRELYVKSIEAE
jgi:hydrogenase nickel incorporation protein HypA/HybF